MNFKRICRILVCLVLVCCLLVQVSPIRANAALEWALLPIAATVVVAGSMAGLFGESAAQVLTGSVEDCVDFLTLNYDFVTDEEKIAVWSTGNPDMPYMVDQNLLDAIREWFFEKYSVDTETGHVCAKSDVEIPEGYWNYNGVVLPELPEFSCYSSTPYILLAKSNNNNYYYLYVTDVAWTAKIDTTWGVGAFHMNGPCHYDVYRFPSSSSDWSQQSCNDVTTESTSGWVKTSLVWANFDLWNEDTLSVEIPATPPLSSDGEYLFTSTAVIASSEDDLPTGYPVWAGNSITIPGTTSDDNMVAYPIGIGQTLEDTLGLTQEDVWAGKSTYVESVTDTETGTDTKEEDKTIVGLLTDVLAAIKSIPEALGEVLSAVLSALFVPSDGWLEAQFAAMQSQFPLADSLIDTMKQFNGFFDGLGQTPPIIYIDLGATEGSYNIGGRTVFVDLTWYADYKPTMDAIIGAFLWLFFLWRLFIVAPDIIRGGAGVIGAVADHAASGRTSPDTSSAPGASGSFTGDVETPEIFGKQYREKPEFGMNSDHSYYEWKERQFHSGRRKK